MNIFYIGGLLDSYQEVRQGDVPETIEVERWCCGPFPSRSYKVIEKYALRCSICMGAEARYYQIMQHGNISSLSDYNAAFGEQAQRGAAAQTHNTSLSNIYSNAAVCPSEKMIPSVMPEFSHAVLFQVVPPWS